MGENSEALRTQRKGKNPRAEQTQRTGGNLMAIRNQQMGAKSKTEVIRSHTLTSKGANARAESTHVNQDEISSSENIFRRLGHEADLRDTLNRMRDQERSQQLTAQNR